jgi:Asp-tRNA(Asn)/Glu-tRNA(Gln) amidotransferase A subunit family amidase
MLQTLSYELSDIKSPVLSGQQLNFFVGLVEKSSMARKGVMALNKIHRLKQKTYSEAPTLLPLPYAEALTLELEKQQDLLEPNARDLLRNHPSPQGWIGIRDYVTRYEEGTLTPSLVAKKVLEQVERSNAGPEPLQAFIRVDASGLRLAAEESSRRYREGRPLSILDGIPIGVKSEIAVDGMDAAAGTSFLRMPAGYPEASIVTRLRQAGALIVGLTNMHEIGMGVTGANLTHGVTRNPFDLKRHTGGSSSGSAAAVAAGLVPLALGTDGGGSIRIPAALCGVLGLKPTFPRLSSFACYPTCVSLCQPGPIAGNAIDCALAYQLMAGLDPRDEKTSLQPPPSLRGLGETQSLEGFTAGVYTAWFEHAEAEVVAVCREHLQKLEERGLKIIEITIPELEEIRVAHFATIASEMFAFMKPHMARHRAELSPSTRFALSLGASISADDYFQAQRIRTRAMQHLNSIFQEVDFIVSPAAAMTAPQIHPTQGDVLNTQQMGQLMRFSQIFNLTGNPAMSFPAGYSREGLPIGIQFGGRWWAEADLLKVAAVSEQLMTRRVPAHRWPILDE